MFKFKKRFCDLKGFGKDDLTEDGYITFGLDYARPFLVEDPDYNDYYDDPGELLEFPVYQDVIPARVVKSPMRTPESDAEAIKWFRRNSSKVWLKGFSTEMDGDFVLDLEAVVLCYKETLLDGDQYFERYYPLAILYKDLDDKFVVRTDIFEEV